MRYLLDTHVLIYLGAGDNDLIPPEVLKLYQNLENDLFVSQISYWEMAIKINIGKLFIPVGLRNIMVQTQQAGIQMIPVSNDQILQYESLPILDDHKDPFDRFLVSTSLVEDLTLVSKDKKFDHYEGLKRIW